MSMPVSVSVSVSQVELYVELAPQHVKSALFGTLLHFFLLSMCSRDSPAAATAGGGGGGGGWGGGGGGCMC